jgi:hypothetical protein
MVTPKGLFTYHAVPLPFRATKGLIYTMRSCLINTCHAMLCHDHAVLKATSQGHGTAWHGHGMACVNWHRPSRDGMWATSPRSASSGYHTEFHGDCFQKHTNPLSCRTRSSDIYGYQADFLEGHGTVGEWQGRGMACVN